MKCRYCDVDLIEGAQYCHMCGGEVESPDLEKLLDVTIVKDDIVDYLFKGYITKEITIGSNIRMKIKTLTQAEQVEYNQMADIQIANLRQASPETLAAIRNQCHAKFALVGLNGDAVPQSLGAALCAIIVFKSSQLEQLVLDVIQRGKLGDF